MGRRSAALLRKAQTLAYCLYASVLRFSCVLHPTIPEQSGCGTAVCCVAAKSANPRVLPIRVGLALFLRLASHHPGTVRMWDGGLLRCCKKRKPSRIAYTRRPCAFPAPCIPSSRNSPDVGRRSAALLRKVQTLAYCLYASALRFSCALHPIIPEQSGCGTAVCCVAAKSANPRVLPIRVGLALFLRLASHHPGTVRMWDGGLLRCCEKRKPSRIAYTLRSCAFPAPCIPPSRNSPGDGTAICCVVL